MPIMMNNNGTQKAVDSIKRNEQEIDKIYIGENLVFNHDAPVYMIRLYKGYVYSLDGKNYNTLYQLSSGESFKFSGYVKGKFVFARWNSDNTNITSNLTKDVRKGTYRNYNINTRCFWWRTRYGY